jgi:hypothetical protein
MTNEQATIKLNRLRDDLSTYITSLRDLSNSETMNTPEEEGLLYNIANEIEDILEDDARPPTESRGAGPQL